MGLQIKGAGAPQMMRAYSPRGEQWWALEWACLLAWACPRTCICFFSSQLDCSIVRTGTALTVRQKKKALRGCVLRASGVTSGGHLLRGFCVNPLPANDLVAALVRPSCNALDAMPATRAEVTLLVPDWARTLPAIDFAVGLAAGFKRVRAAVVATRAEVFSDLLMITIGSKVEK